MHITNLNGRYIKLIKTTSHHVDLISRSSNALPGGDIQGILESKNTIYWSVIDKNDKKLIGVVGVTQGLEVNSIFYKFLPLEPSSYDLISETIELIVQYLEYKKMTGAYSINSKKFTRSQIYTLKNGGFKQWTQDSWLLDL